MSQFRSNSFGSKIDNLDISPENKRLLQSLHLDGWKVTIDDSEDKQAHATVTMSASKGDYLKYFIQLQPWEGPHGKLEGYKIEEWDSEKGKKAKKVVYYDLPETIAFERAQLRLSSHLTQK